MASLRDLTEIAKGSPRLQELATELDHGVDTDLALAGGIAWDAGEKEIGAALEQLSVAIDNRKRMAAAA